MKFFNYKNKKNAGFTLLELLCTLALLGFLLTLSIPYYESYLQKARRTEAQSALYDMADFMEEYYMDHESYTDATLPYTQTSSDWYSLSIIEQTEISFTLKATPQGAQAHDTVCQAYTLTNTGHQGIAVGPAGLPTGTINDCW